MYDLDIHRSRRVTALVLVAAVVAVRRGSASFAAVEQPRGRIFVWNLTIKIHALVVSLREFVAFWHLRAFMCSRARVFYSAVLPFK